MLNVHQYLSIRVAHENDESKRSIARRLHHSQLGGPWAPTPAERWMQRQSINGEQRASLAVLIDQNSCYITQSIQRERREKGLAVQFTAACRASVARTATRQALEQLGYLTIRRPANTSTENSVALSRN